jgi:hypothetical protein
MVYERMRCVPYVEFTFFAQFSSSIHIFCPSFFSIRRVSSNTVLFAIVYLINKEGIVTSVVLNYYINVSARVMSREGVSLNYASYTER